MSNFRLLLDYFLDFVTVNMLILKIFSPLINENNRCRISIDMAWAGGLLETVCFLKYLRL